MADSELGELRRPPRVIEQRIERTARWRAQGLGGGSSDALFPAGGDAVSGAAGSEDGASAAGSTWTYDQFNITSSTTSPLTLTYVADLNSEVVSLNGVRLIPTVDYTLDGQTLTLLDLTGLRLGIGANTWTLMVSYVYTDTAPAPFEPSDFLTWALNGSAVVAGSTIQLHSTLASTAGSIVSNEIAPSGWNVIDVTVNLNISTGGDGWQVILWDGATHTTAELAMGGTRFSGVYDALWPAYSDTEYQSNDGTTTINLSNVGPFGVTGVADNDYRIVWTKTSPTTASVAVYVNSILAKSSPSDVWVPATVRLGIYGFNGSLSNNAKVVKSVSFSAAE